MIISGFPPLFFSYVGSKKFSFVKPLKERKFSDGIFFPHVCRSLFLYLRHFIIIIFINFSGKAVPFIEMMVTHASVLTILAISFERYYAICEPLKAGYICTKTRAFFICLCAWLLAGLLTRYINYNNDNDNDSNNSNNFRFRTFSGEFFKKFPVIYEGEKRWLFSHSK